MATTSISSAHTLEGQVSGVHGYFPLKHHGAVERHGSPGHVHREGSADRASPRKSGWCGPTHHAPGRPGLPRWDPAGSLLGVLSFSHVTLTGSFLTQSCCWGREGEDTVALSSTRAGTLSALFSMHTLGQPRAWHTVGAQSVSAEWMNEGGSGKDVSVAAWLKVHTYETPSCKRKNISKTRSSIAMNLQGQLEMVEQSGTKQSTNLRPWALHEHV